MVHFPQTRLFLEKLLIIFIFFFNPFHFAKFLGANPELWGSAIFGLKMAYVPPKLFFFRNPLIKLVPCSSFMSIYIRIIKFSNQSPNEILTSKENLNLIGQEHFWL